MGKPRVKFCWECGRKLWGNNHVLKKIHDEVRTLHISCGQLYPQIPPYIIIKDPPKLSWPCHHGFKCSCDTTIEENE